MDAHDFLRTLALVLCVAAVTTVVFQRLRQPVVLGYLLAGVVVGPHTSIPLSADVGIIHAVSELGVILLMFSLGLEFSLRKLARVGPGTVIIAIIEVSVMLLVGAGVARALGEDGKASLFIGAMVAISSTTIIAKAFDEQGTSPQQRARVFGILVVEDLIAIVLLATLTAVGSGAGLDASALAETVGRLAGFLAAMVAAGLLVVPRMFRAVVKLGRAETTLVAAVGVCFAMALIAEEAGYATALGAFLGGALVAESGEERTLAPLIQPVRDMFGALFFVSVGMLIEPARVIASAPTIALLVVVVVVGKLFAVTMGSFLAGRTLRTAVEAGMSMAQIGELSFIVASIGVEFKAIPADYYPIAVAVSAITTLTTPFAIRAADRVADVVDHRLPRPIATVASLYGSWIDRLRVAGRPDTAWRRLRRRLILLMVDAALLVAVIVGAALLLDPAAIWVEGKTQLPGDTARIAVIVGAAALCLPFALGLVRLARSIGTGLANLALPPANGGADLAAAPRRALLVTLQLTVLIAVGTPMVFVTSPLLPPFAGVAFIAIVLVIGIGFWRSATNLDEHVRAGALAIVEVLAAQSHAELDAHALDPVEQLLPGLGTPTAVKVDPASEIAGMSLAAANLRGATGATVLAIQRGDRSIPLPSADDTLEPGDLIALAGSHDAIAAARILLGAAALPARSPDP